MVAITVTIFAKCIIMDVWQASEHAAGSDYAEILDIPGLHRVLNMSE